MIDVNASVGTSSDTPDALPPDAASGADTLSPGTHSPGTQPPTAPQSPAPHRSILSNWTVLLLGVALVLAASDPTKLGQHGPVGWLLTAAAVVAAIWAAPVVAQRPTMTSIQWAARLVRHRNTVFAVGCTVLAGAGNPPVWLMVADAALLLAYLLIVDALAAGPIGIRQLRRGVAPLAAAGASAVVLLGALAPVNQGAVWGRILAALAVAAAALAAGAALWIRQTGAQPPTAARRSERRGPRHL